MGFEVERFFLGAFFLDILLRYEFLPSSLRPDFIAELLISLKNHLRSYDLLVYGKDLSMIIPISTQLL